MSDIQDTRTHCPPKDIAGIPFGRLTPIAPIRIQGRWCWQCQCECGSEKIVTEKNLVSHNSESCGCLKRDKLAARNITHGASVRGKMTREYKSWAAMKDRCCNLRCEDFPDYGGRGITVCERWLGEDGFSNFLADMGKRPPGHEIDRKDNYGNYEPGNCRWATRTEQTCNTRKNVFIEYRGERLTISQWSRRTGINYCTLYSRVKAGWDVGRILTT